MPDLTHALQKRDLGFFKMVANAWGIECSAPDGATALPAVVDGILNHPHIEELVDSLPAEAQNALYALMQNEGRIPWAAFTRQYGDLRGMGAARRDRERPDLKPASTTEILWYRALIARAFMQMPGDREPQEYAYIPDDLLVLLPTLQPTTPEAPGRHASPVECAHPQPVTDQILDDACTLLAALRLKIDEEGLNALPLRLPAGALRGLLDAAHLLDYDGIPHPERTRAFLEAPRGKALAQLCQAWMEDKYFNELRLLPGLRFEGEWANDPLRARQAILELASQVPEAQWWSLPAFVSAIQVQHPDFQRPAGDYDSWFIRQESSGTYLRGFGSWDEVDGALVRFLITGPMHWLGLLDLASPEAGAPASAFRLSAWAEALWHGDPPAGLPAEEAALKVSADGRLRLPVLAPRALRYQVARFCQWDGMKGSGASAEYLYRITPGALERARAQNLRPSQLAGLLRRHAEGPLPPSLAQALDRWETQGTQVIVERASLLRVTSPEILAALRKGRAGRCLGESLNDTVAQVRPGMEEALIAAITEAGYLSMVRLIG